MMDHVFFDSNFRLMLRDDDDNRIHDPDLSSNF